MSPPPGTSFLPDQETAVLLPDLARVCRQLGVQFVRASVVDIHSRAYQGAWSISETGEVSPSATDRPMDSAFAGAADAIASLADAEPEQTLVHKQSPRRWAFAWPHGAGTAVVAEVQYRERRDSVNDIDRVLVRLLCSASVRRHAPALGQAAPEPPAQVWPQVERRAPARPAKAVGAPLVLAAAAALLAAWVALVAGAQGQQALAAQRARADSMADATLVHGLTAALSTGDYGEVQNTLNQFQQLGYFRSAAVVNTNARVVALGGAVEGQRVGDPLNPAYGAVARSLDLALGTVRQGRVLLVAPVAAAPATLDGLRTGAGLAAAAALAAALWLALTLRRR